MKSRKKRLREVYVWELPVRIYHWVNALCIAILCVTGFIIADPPAIMSASEAYFSYWFGVVRFIHFVTAFVFFFNFVFRLYWGFVGNRYARWNNFIPLKKSQWKEVLEVIKVDILMIKNKPVDSIGHNALASSEALPVLLLLFRDEFHRHGVLDTGKREGDKLSRVHSVQASEDQAPEKRETDTNPVDRELERDS